MKKRIQLITIILLSFTVILPTASLQAETFDHAAVKQVPNAANQNEQTMNDKNCGRMNEMMKKQMKTMMADHKTMMAEMKSLFTELRSNGNLTKAQQTKMENLQEKMKQMQLKMKKMASLKMDELK